MPIQRQAAESRDEPRHKKEAAGTDHKLPDQILDARSFRQDLGAFNLQQQKDVATKHLPEMTIFDDSQKSTVKYKPVEGPQQAGQDRVVQAEIPRAAPESEPKRYELNLKHSVHGTRAADAVVLLPKNFDATKPIHLVIYNHGWRDTAPSAFRNAKLEEQMKGAPPNTVLVVPEWQVNPGAQHAKGNQQGAYASKDFATKMLQDVFDKTPQLHGKTLANVDRIGLISHSAGYMPTESQLKANPELAKKVNSITLLDSQYNAQGFNGWIKDNIADLAGGKKTFQNIFGSSTRTHATSSIFPTLIPTLLC